MLSQTYENHTGTVTNLCCRPRQSPLNLAQANGYPHLYKSSAVAGYFPNQLTPFLDVSATLQNVAMSETHRACLYRACDEEQERSKMDAKYLELHVWYFDCLLTVSWIPQITLILVCRP